MVADAAVVVAASVVQPAGIAKETATLPASAEAAVAAVGAALTVSVVPPAGIAKENATASAAAGAAVAAAVGAAAVEEPILLKPIPETDVDYPETAPHAPCDYQFSNVHQLLACRTPRK